MRVANRPTGMGGDDGKASSELNSTLAVDNAKYAYVHLKKNGVTFDCE